MEFYSTKVSYSFTLFCNKHTKTFISISPHTNLCQGPKYSSLLFEKQLQMPALTWVKKSNCYRKDGMLSLVYKPYRQEQ